MTPPSKSPSELVLADDAVLPAAAFEPYVEHLASLLDKTVSHGASARRAEVASALDGQPGRQLRKLYSATKLRGTGTYFTGSKLANRLVLSLARRLPNASQIVDPACGAGDLLVACARYLPIQTSAGETMRDWGARLAGFDINSAFVEAARYRLALLAIERTQAAAPMGVPEMFGNIRHALG